MVGGSFKGVGEDDRNGAVPWDDVQVSGTESAYVWKRKLGGDRGDVEYPGGFCHRVDRWITGMTAKFLADRKWECTQVVEALEAAGLHPIQEYIRRRQATILAQVACRHSCELCTEAERRPGKIRIMIWWYQDVVHECEE